MKNEELRMKNASYSYLYLKMWIYGNKDNKGNFHSSFFILHSSFFTLHSSLFILHSSFFILNFLLFILTPMLSFIKSFFVNLPPIFIILT